MEKMWLLTSFRATEIRSSNFETSFFVILDFASISSSVSNFFWAEANSSFSMRTLIRLAKVLLLFAVLVLMDAS